jgi:hypothetical protein
MLEPVRSDNCGIGAGQLGEVRATTWWVTGFPVWGQRGPGALCS